MSEVAKVAPLQLRPNVFLWMLSLVWLSILLSLVTLRPEYVPFEIVCLGCACVGLWSFWRPVVLLFFIVIASSIAGVLATSSSISTGGADVTPDGFLWVFVSLQALLLVGLRWRSVHLPRHFFFFLVFEAWVVFRWFLNPDLSGLKDVLFYGFPMLIAAYASVALSRSHRRLPARLGTLILWVPLVPLAYLVIGLLIGIVQYIPGYGPKGPFEPRGMCAFLLVCLSLGLATWKYGRNKIDRKIGAFSSVLSVLIIIFTLSRSAIAVSLLLLSISWIDRGRFWRNARRLTMVGAIVVMVFSTVPELRSRLLFSGESPLSEGLSVSDINTEGRTVFWAVTFAHAIERPIVGWGTGSARQLVASTFPGGRWTEYYPHNEYLEVFHDLGLIGLVLMLSAWLGLLWRYGKAWHSSDGRGDLGQARWDLAVFLALLVILLDIITNNDLHYAFVTGPAFLMLGLCEYQRKVPRRLMAATAGAGT